MPTGNALKPILVRLGNRVRHLRSTAGMTQEVLARKGAISISFLSMIERGERAAHLETILRLAAVLKVTVAELFMSSEGEPKPLDAVLKPVADFVRVESLTRDDVQRLLAVGRAMFK